MDNIGDVKKYVETSKEKFWQDVFLYETKYLVSCLGNYRDVLSVGCGPAVIESKLSDHGLNVTGLDISQEALKCAPDNVRTFTGSAEDMNFAESSFDAVIYVVSLQFIEDYRKALQNSYMVLRPKGRIIVMLLNPQSDFFKRKLLQPDSYVNMIRHTDLQETEKVMRNYFDIKTEYILGIRGEEIFESNSPDGASLYVIVGRKKESGNAQEF